MKILILTTELAVHNGWGRYSLGLVRILEAHGHKTEVATMASGRINIEKATLPLLPKFIPYTKSFFFALWYAWKLRKIARQCDVVHSLVEPYAYIAYWVSKLANKPYIITAHGTYATLPLGFNWPLSYFHAKALRNAKNIICVSAYTKKRLGELGFMNTSVINNGIHMEDFPNSPPSFSGRENILLTVGALKPRKGQHVSLEAFALVARDYPEAHYYIVGDQNDSQYFTRLKHIVVMHGIERHVHFLSSISEDDLHALYARAKAFILSSLTAGGHYEGFGLVYLEANASGVPTIGSRDSGAEDAIQDGMSGFLVEQENAIALAHAVGRLFSDKALWTSMSGSGVEWARAHDWEHLFARYDTLYRTTL